MRYCIFLFLLVLTSIILGQNPKLLKKEIQERLIESIDKYSLTNEWYICNKDSSYYLSDTIKIFNHVNYLYDPSNCCSFVCWDFKNKSIFHLREIFICQEPPIGKVIFNNKYKISWESDKNELVLLKKNYLNRVEKFIVLDFREVALWNKIQTCFVLTLKRIN